jgi:hypothetical protein
MNSKGLIEKLKIEVKVTSTWGNPRKREQHKG